MIDGSASPHGGNTLPLPDVFAKDVRPFLKWAGGKRWLVSAGLPRPVSFKRYIEPFLGGGAVFFALQPEVAILSDINSELVSLYEMMRRQPEELFEGLQRHHAKHSPEHYYEVRASAPGSEIERAVRMLYLNRTCWNGLYRVNRRGEFNVPIGTKTAVVMPDDDFHLIADVLEKAEIRCCDFEETVDCAGEGDFLFVDPPYTVKHNMNGFVKYNECIFTWADQVRLRDAVARSMRRGAAVVVTNADHPSVVELYRDIAEYRSVPRSSVLAGHSDRRGRTTEALFMVNC